MTRGEIWTIDFGMPFGSEPGYRRPALVVQTDALNLSAFNTTLVITVTSNTRLAEYRGNVLIPKSATGLHYDSVALAAQISIVDKSRLIEKCGKVPPDLMQKVDDALSFTLAIGA